MINFIWIVLLTIIGTIIVSALVVSAVYLMWDGLVKFIIKKKMPKDKKDMLDGGKDFPTDEKEVKLKDGQFREFERLREASIRERTAKTKPDSEGYYADESRDVKLDAIASEVAKSDKPTVDNW